MKLVIIGGGMLARALYDSATANGHPATVLGHPQIDVALLGSVQRWGSYFDAADMIINCAGRLPPSGAIESVLTNSLGPHILASQLHTPMIHISTDCVFSGWVRQRAPCRHLPDETPNPDSLYGRTKLAGEVDSPLVWNVRTSFVGPDHGLWAWIASREDNEVVEGWSEAWWSGSTVWAVADALVQMAANLPPKHHTLHLATSQPITKLEAVTQIASHLKKPLRIVPTAHRLDRSLAPTYVLKPLALGLSERALLEVS